MDELRTLLSRCVKCGRCRSVCPVFKTVHRETAVARGKLALVESAARDREALDGELAKSLSTCLLCGTCTANCPNEAQAHEAIRRARSLVARNHGLPLSKKLLARGMAEDRTRRDRLIRRARPLQSSLTTALPENRGLRFRFPLRRIHRGWVPELASEFFLDRHSGTIAVPGDGPKVGLFAGCAIHYLAPQIGEATLGLLNRMGFSVVIPEEQGCCGLMAFGMGDDRSAEQAALKTMEVFERHELDHIVVPCASCAEQLKHGYPAIFKEAKDKLPRAEEFSAKVCELSDFLHRQGAAEGREAGERSDAAPQRVVTYHDPCHLARGLGIREAPRALLRSLRSWKFREMDKADQCCGMGGSFRLSNPEIAGKILSEKLDAVQQSEARAVVTGCMGCWMHLREGICNAGRDVEVLHPAEILWREQEEDPSDP